MFKKKLKLIKYEEKYEIIMKIIIIKYYYYIIRCIPNIVIKLKILNEFDEK